MTTIEQYKQIFGSDYCGFDVFFEKVLSPLFGNRIERKNEDLLASGQYREKAERLKIKKMSFVAMVDAFAPINVIDITVDNSCHLERSRVYIKELVRQMLENYAQAFIIFHYAKTEGEPWRFSYIYKEGRQSDVTPAKRFTYVFGRNYSGRTAAERFATLQGKAMESAEDFKTAFSVETLSDEFFVGYKAQYEKFCNYLYGNKDNEKQFGAKFTEWEDKVLRDYVKKMLGRLVFVQFLNRKGWAPNLREAFDNHPELQDNFLDAYLEPLFGGALNIAEEYRLDEFRRNADRGWDAKLISEFSTVPYLNGGLFENDVQDPPRSRFPKEYFSELFDFFDQYNFTIDENDPNDAVVGVDPEMLGRIFENLLEDNKDKGAFYTPKEIVQYMCRESLIAYLQTDAKDDAHRERLRRFVETHDATVLHDAEFVRQKIENVKICDPAIGSGAFPMGLLNELVACREALGLHIDKNANRAEIKKHIIQNSIYGVDIEKGAVDIARLRFWLSIVVDEDEPQVLPNLDYKIMQGNSLLEQYEGFDLGGLTQKKTDEKGMLTLFDDMLDVYRKQLRDLLGKYYNTADHKLKQQQRVLIQENVVKQLKEQCVKADLSDINIAANDQFFLWHTWFNDVFEKGGFDIVIGNPPYISHDNIPSNIPCNSFLCFEPFADLYCYFYEKGMNLLSQEGILSFVTSNSYLRANYGLPLRQVLRNNCSVIQIIDIEGTQLFGAAIVNTAVCSFQKTKHECAATIVNAEWLQGDFNSFVNSNRFYYQQKDFDLQPWTLVKPENLVIRRKIEIAGKTLEDLNTKIRLGIATGDNNAFILNEEQKNSLILEDSKNAEIIKPIIRGQDIQRYCHTSPKYVLLTKNGVDVKNDYPTIYQYLDSFGDKFKQRGAKGRHWTNLRACAFFDDFLKEKIVWIELTDVGRFSLSVKEEYLLNSAYFLLPPESFKAKYLLGILNSSVIRFYIKQIAATSGMGTLRWINNYVKLIPIPAATIIQQGEIIKLVDEILVAKKADSNADTNREEHDIDLLVYHLYGLSYDEVKVIDATVTESEFNRKK